jgi:hypothetical protein
LVQLQLSTVTLLVSRISTSNNDQAIQVQAAARGHSSAHLLACSDLIDTPAQQIETTLAQKWAKICQSSSIDRNMSRMKRNKNGNQPWFLYDARTSFVISNVLFENSPSVPPVRKHKPLSVNSQTKKKSFSYFVK